MSESVYERAREALDGVVAALDTNDRPWLLHVRDRLAVEIALDAGEAAEKRAEAAERRIERIREDRDAERNEAAQVLDAANSKVRELRAESTRQADRAAQYERDWHDAKSEFGDQIAKHRNRAKAMECERDEARNAKRTAEENELKALHDLDDARALLARCKPEMDPPKP